MIFLLFSMMRSILFFLLYLCVEKKTKKTMGIFDKRVNFKPF